MSTYAVLGATGRVGGSIMEILMENPSNTLHLYVRSKDRIISSHPELKNNERVKIFEGDIHDVKVIKSCIQNTKAIFLAVALSENLPGCSVAIDTARVVVSALKELRDSQTQTQSNPSQQLPRLVVLSSSSVSDNFWTNKPWFLHRIVYNANANIYNDLKVAETHLREQRDWLRVSFIKPGILSDDIRRGYTLSTKNFGPPMAFGDLAAAMIEIADATGDMYDGDDLSILPKEEGQGARVPRLLPYTLGKGLTAYYLPGVYMYVRGWLP